MCSRPKRIPSTFAWDFSPSGQHIELGIAEMNLFLMLAALGLSHTLFGERLLPVGTLYDPFIERGLDALNYACYQDARFILVATPSGVTLAPEGGAHQSIATPLIGMAQDGLASFEPAFVDELAIDIALRIRLCAARRRAEKRRTTWLHERDGGSVYLRLSTRPIEQPLRRYSESARRRYRQGGYWLRRPGPNAEIVVALRVRSRPRLSRRWTAPAVRRDIGLLAVTSADRLNAGWTAAQRAREHGRTNARSQSSACWRRTRTLRHRHGARRPSGRARLAGVVHGHRLRSLGVEHFGQTGTISDLYRHYGIDAAAIVEAAMMGARRKP